MKYREVAERLRRLGCRELARKPRGSHRKWLNPNTGRGTVVPDDLKLGTVRAALRQLGIEWEEFEGA